MDPRRSAAYYDRLAPEYDHQLSRPGDVWVRGAFQEFVRARLPLGARLLDFGCGTGIDAAWYAAQGYRVLAFDNSEGMIARLRETCAAAIERQQIEPWLGSYESFEAGLGSHGPIEAVAANFAVVNLLPALGPWFAALARWLAPGSGLFLSALNPLSLSEISRPRGFLKVLRYTFGDGVPFPDAESPHFRYWPSAITRAAADFQLVSLAGPASLIRYDRGPRDWRHPASLGERLEQQIYRRALWCHLGRFTFLELRRCG
jgi:SAM-dependent methyltransferase